VRPRRVLVVDADEPLFGLLEAWLSAEGCVVINDRAGPADDVDLVIVDVPFPRQVGVDWIRRIAQRHPMAPILALSSTFIAGIECCGPAARALGVACTLPNPVSRQALSSAVRRLLPS
jgi:DNA-binding response OmpR family regulator